MKQHSPLATVTSPQASARARLPAHNVPCQHLDPETKTILSAMSAESSPNKETHAELIRNGVKHEPLEAANSEFRLQENTNEQGGKPDEHDAKMEEDGELQPEVDEATEAVKEEKDDSNGTSAKRRAPADLVVVPHKKPQLFYSLLKTGLVYDVRMRYHAKIFTLYFEYIDPHPEDPRRIYRIYKKLAEAGLIQDTSLSGTEDIGPLMVKIPIREATADEILEVHSEEHLRFILLTEAMTRAQLLEETEKGDSIYVNNDLYLLAKLLCGGSIEACKAVVEGRVKNSLAIVRPPGHHAEPDTPGGFCLFSNVAVAAKNMLKAYPDLVRRIVIVDWDIHHGNGTQRAFYDDPRVLYISLHRYENGKFYPGTRYGGHDQVGSGKGEGFTVNVPWQTSGVGDGDYAYAFHKVIIPIISEFDPDLVIVSAGFDAADGDLIGQCHVSPTGYGQMTHMLKAVARGKLAVILEGGYNLESIAKSALGVAKVLVGEPPESTIVAQPRPETVEVVAEVMRVQARYWRSMRPGTATKTLDDAADGVTFAEPVRAHQAHSLFTKYGFVGLPVVDGSGFSTDLPNLDDLVLALPDIHTCSTIVVAVHDPPEVWANIHPLTGTIDPSTSVLFEHPLLSIIEKVKSEILGVGYIDINVPAVASSNYSATIFAQELVLWVWNNYLAYFKGLKKVVFVGFGDLYQAIVHLYAKRPAHEIRELVKGTVVFAGRTTLKPLVPVMDESMVDWYYQNSVVFTSHMNGCWKSDDEAGKRPRRKFGRVLKATADGLWDVINERLDEGVDFVLDLLEDDESET